MPFKIVHHRHRKIQKLKKKQEIVCDYLFEWQNGTWVPDGSFDGIFLRCEKKQKYILNGNRFEVCGLKRERIISV